MHRRSPSIFFAAVSVLAFALVAGVVSLPKLQAQPAQTAAQTAPPPATGEPSGAKPTTQEAKSPEQAPGQEAGKEKENDPTEALKQSTLVKWIARVTGLSVNAAYWICVVLNFAIVLGVLVWLLRKTLPAAFKTRTELIQKRIEEARKASEEARRRLSEVEGRLSRLDVEITEMRREAEQNGLAEEKRVLAGAEEERRRIVATAEQEITMAANAARRDLKSYAAELAVDLAGKKIQVGRDADQALVREFTTQLGKDGN
jgi:F-type H+-transporting ATPase subunit b